MYSEELIQGIADSISAQVEAEEPILEPEPIATKVAVMNGGLMDPAQARLIRMGQVIRDRKSVV